MKNAYNGRFFALIGALFFSAMVSLSVYAAPEQVRVGEQGAETIQKAIAKVAAGGTVTVPSGVYKETVSITKSVNLIGEDGAVLDGTGMVIGQDDGIDMIRIKASGALVQNLEITGLCVNDLFCEAAVGIRVEAGSENVFILDCCIHDMGVGTYDPATAEWAKDEEKAGETYNCHGIIIKSMKDQPVKNVTVSGCKLRNLKLGQSEALVVNGNVDGFEICNNTIEDCDNIGIDVIGFEEGKSYQAKNGSVHHNVVRNICSDPKKNPTYPSACAGGIYVDGGTLVSIHDNTVIGCDIGIEISSEAKGKKTDYITVENNTLIGNESLGGLCIGGCDPEENGAAENCKILHNTIYNEKNPCLIIQNANHAGNEIKNNVLIGLKGIVYDDYDSTKNKVENNITNKPGDAAYNRLDPTGAAAQYSIQNLTVDKAAGTVSFSTDAPEGTYGRLSEQTELSDPTEGGQGSQEEGGQEEGGQGGSGGGTIKPGEGGGNGGEGSSKDPAGKTQTDPGQSGKGGSDEKADTILIDDALYEIREGGVLFYFGPVCKDDKTYTIPNTVSYKGKKVKVTGICEGAFDGCVCPSRIIIGKYVRQIPKNAFRGKRTIRLVIVRSKVLKKVGKGAFKNLAKKARIELPKKKKKAYKKLFKKNVTGKTCLKWV